MGIKIQAPKNLTNFLFWPEEELFLYRDEPGNLKRQSQRIPQQRKEKYFKISCPFERKKGLGGERGN